MTTAPAPTQPDAFDLAALRAMERANRTPDPAVAIAAVGEAVCALLRGLREDVRSVDLSVGGVDQTLITIENSLHTIEGAIDA